MTWYQLLLTFAALIFFLGIYFIIPTVYIGIRLMLGHHITNTMRENEEYKRGIELVDQERYQEALRFFDAVLSHHPKSAVAWAHKAWCNFAMDNLHEAMYNCDKAINYDYSLSDCYLIKGKALFALEEYQLAHEEFAKAVWHFKDKAVPYRLKGRCNYHLGNYDEAKVDFQRAIRYHDEDANYLLHKMENEQDAF
ncbi:tetratricopeptide repeat protein [Microscilla marina]|uniref:Conserved TPR domain protein, putative n=1 Tax=Microscilla marina ATCC 23134 TaxID=313606 RepID=A1ZT16_MICM2|nr:tetratricopeptide repeat protein [Microscilla marina]EAY26406.1 conserved TPR domain protein, putative [Microscilla marina ATCC 23134]